MSRRALTTAELRDGKIEKIKDHYLKGRKLSDKLLELRDIYLEAFNYQVQGYSYEQTVQILHETTRKAKSTCYRLVRESMDLHGDINKTSNEAKRQIIYENLMRLYQINRKEKNYEEARKNLEAAAKVYGLFNPDNKEFDPRTIIIPIPVYSTDPEALKQGDDEVGSYELLEQLDDTDEE